jgi:hypothetical protein
MPVLPDRNAHFAWLLGALGAFALTSSAWPGRANAEDTVAAANA